MAVPHTRPVQVTNHATAKRLLVADNVWRGRDPDPVERAVTAGAPARGVGPRRDRVRRAHPALCRPVRLPRGRRRRCCARSARSPACSGRPPRSMRPPRSARPRSPSRSRTPRRSAAVVAGLEQQYDAFHREASDYGGGPNLLGDEGGLPEPTSCRPARSSARSSSSSWPASTSPRTSRAMPASVAELVELLDLEAIEDNLFRGKQPDTLMQRVFGGQVAAHALVAASRTVDPSSTPCTRCTPTSCDPGTPRCRSSTTSTTPGGSLVRDPPGAGPPARPADLRDDAELPGPRGRPRAPGHHAGRAGARGLPAARRHRRRSREDAGASEEWMREWAALDVRYAGNSRPGGEIDVPGQPARARLWIRADGDLPDDPLQHTAAFTYASDMTLLGADPGAARGVHLLAVDAGGLAGPLDLVPPAVPGRPVVALRPAQPVGVGRPRPGHRAASSPRTAGWSPASPRRA